MKPDGQFLETLGSTRQLVETCQKQLDQQRTDIVGLLTRVGTNEDDIENLMEWKNARIRIRKKFWGFIGWLIPIVISLVPLILMLKGSKL